jgi:polysaccharide pyruvyl transferase WcaK-like protein
VGTRAFSIIAATFHGNRGAEAMLETVIGRLSAAEPGLRFHVFSYYPAEDRKLVDDPRVSFHSSTPLALVAWLLPWALLFGVLRRVAGRGVYRMAPAAIRALAGSDALVDLAGVAFIDGREKFLPFNVLTLLPAMLLGTPVVKMPQAVGPFEHRANRLAARWVLPRCAMVWARGGRTMQHLDGAAFAGVQRAQADDIAFNFDAAWSLTREGVAELPHMLAAIDALRLQPGIRGIVGVCPSAVLAVQARKGSGDYEPALVGLVRGLTADGFGVVLFPNATRAEAGDAERNNDLPLMRRIHAASVAAGIGRPPLLADFDLNAAGIKQVIARADVLLVSRFHAMVGALSMGVPTAVLGWSHKYAEVMARFGLDGVVMDYKALSAEQLLASVQRLFEQRAQVRAAIVARLPEVQASAGRPVLALLQPSLGADLA